MAFLRVSFLSSFVSAIQLNIERNYSGNEFSTICLLDIQKILLKNFKKTYASSLKKLTKSKMTVFVRSIAFLPILNSTSNVFF